MPRVGRVLETSLYVDDPDRSAHFYQDLFHFNALVRDHRMWALDVSGVQVLLLFRKGASLQPMPIPGGIIPPSDGSGDLHLAFTIDEADLPAWEEALASRDIPIESRVNWERGGHSIYFRDPDNHLVELVTPGCWAIY